MAPTVNGDYNARITDWSEILDEGPRSTILGLFEFCDFRANFDAGKARNFDQF